MSRKWKKPSFVLVRVPPEFALTNRAVAWLKKKEVRKMKKVVWVILIVLLVVFIVVFFCSLSAKAGGHYNYGHGHHYVAGSNFWAGFLVGSVAFFLVDQLILSQKPTPTICGQWTYVPVSDAYGNSLGYYTQSWVQLPCR